LIKKLELLRKQENLIIFDLLKKHCYKVNNNLYKFKYLKFFLSQLYCYPDQQNTIHFRGIECIRLKRKKVGAESKERMAPLFKNWKMVELFIPVTRKSRKK